MSPSFGQNLSQIMMYILQKVFFKYGQGLDIISEVYNNKTKSKITIKGRS